MGKKEMTFQGENAFISILITLLQFSQNPQGGHPASTAPV